MRSDEYDRLIDDPTAFLLEVWLPRVGNADRLSWLNHQLNPEKQLPEGPE